MMEESQHVVVFFTNLANLRCWPLASNRIPLGPRSVKVKAKGQQESVCILEGWSGPMDGSGQPAEPPSSPPPTLAVSRAMASSPLLISPFLLLTLLPSSSSSFSSLPSSPSTTTPLPLRNTSLYPVCTSDVDCGDDKKCFQYFCSELENVKSFTRTRIFQSDFTPRKARKL